MAVHTFEDAMTTFDTLLTHLDANIRSEVLEEIAERALAALGSAARQRVIASAKDDEDEDDEDEDTLAAEDEDALYDEDDDVDDLDEDVDDDEDDGGQPS